MLKWTKINGSFKADSPIGEVSVYTKNGDWYLEFMNDGYYEIHASESDAKEAVMDRLKSIANQFKKLMERQIVVWLHFNKTSLTPSRHKEGSSNTYDIKCQSVKYLDSSIIRISFSPDELKENDVKNIILNRELKEYGDSNNKFVDIPISELYSIDVRVTR